MDEATFFSEAFMPHGHCYFWTPSVLWTHVISDAVITLSYYTIPLALIVLVRRRTDLAFSWMFLLFGTFIFACGTTHLVSIWTTWNPEYGFEGLVKAFTAVVSGVTAVLVWPLVPRVLALPSPAQLARVNSQLADEVRQRAEAERQLRELNVDLDARVRSRMRELAERADELARSNRDLEQFASVVSHDLKSPLRGIAALSEILSSDHAASLGADGISKLDLMIERVQRLYRLIDGVLAYSRAGGEQHLESVSPSNVARQVVASLEIPPAIAISVEPEIPHVLYDPHQLLQVLQNLIVNAVRHMGVPTGSIRVRGESDGELATIRVEDDGVGIDPMHHERIFRIFQALAPGGTGIGLAIVQKIVERHGGRVTVESAPGRGSVFKFSARRAPPAA